VLFLLLTRELGGLPRRLSMPERKVAGVPSEGVEVWGEAWLPFALRLVGVPERPFLELRSGGVAPPGPCRFLRQKTPAADSPAWEMGLRLSSVWISTASLRGMVD